MDKILERLKLLGERGDDKADQLYWAAKDLGAEAFPIWVAENDADLRSVLKFPSLMDDSSDEDKALLKEYTNIRNSGISAYAGDKKTDVYGRPMKSLDDYMGAFGVESKKGEGYTDDDRSAFTNPDNSAYWGNKSEEDRQLAALSLGYDSFDEMERDLQRAGDEYQTRNRYEGWDENNNFTPMWFASAIVGLGAPRVKEAMVAGRDVTWQDVAGDMAELSLNFVPGVGIVGKGGKVIAKIPVAGKLAETAGGRMVGQGATLAAEQFAVPGLTQAVDAGVLYNPDVLGTETSGLNARSDFDLKKMTAQAGAIAGTKGAVKGAAMMGKNMLEQGYGNEIGGGLFRQGVKTFERIGEKTDDIINRRQAMLDRKAELAKQQKYVPTSEGQLTGASLKDKYIIDVNNPSDVINADNYRILTDEARNFAKSQKIRDKYNTNGVLLDQDINPEAEAIVMLDDGRYAYRSNGNLLDNGNTWTPEGSEVAYAKPGYTPVQADYDFEAFPGKVYRKYGDEATMYKKIQDDENLSRLLDGSTALKENVRDVAANAAFNAMAREGLVGNSSVTSIDEKRERALWNSMLGKLRNLTTDPKLSVETRKENADAVMNVMTYGLDGLPAEIYEANPMIYKAIAAQLGVDNWRHYSEYDAAPTQSASTATYSSSSMGDY